MVPSENSLLEQDLGYLHFSTPILLKQFDGGDLFGNLEKTALIVFVWVDLVFPLGCTAASHLLPAWSRGRFLLFVFLIFVFFPFPLCGSYNRNNHFLKWKRTHSLFIISATNLLLILHVSFCSLKDNLEIWVIIPRLIGDSFEGGQFCCGGVGRCQALTS